MICFLDIDEVLVDFVGPALGLHNLRKEFVESIWPETEWSLQRVLNWSGAKFWKPINKSGAGFWETLPEKPWIDDILGLISKEFQQDYYLVSSPSKCPTSYTGKVNWITSKFGKDFDQFILTPHKELLAAPNRVLIDDRPENCEKFIKGYLGQPGGHAILFPMWGNKNRKHLDNPVEYVTDEISKLLNEGTDPYLSQLDRHLMRQTSTDQG